MRDFLGGAESRGRGQRPPAWQLCALSTPSSVGLPNLLLGESAATLFSHLRGFSHHSDVGGSAMSDDESDTGPEDESMTSWWRGEGQSMR